MYTNLVLSAGGARGFAFAGALDELVQQGALDLSRVTTFAGTSIGAMVCCMLAVGFSTQELIQEAVKVDTRAFLHVSLATAMYNWGLDDQARPRAYLESCVLLKTGRRDLTFRELYENRGRHLRVCAANLTRNESRYFSPDTTPDLGVVDAVLMSMAVPIIFAPVRYDGDLYVDGAFLDSFPMSGLDPACTIGVRLQWEIACDLDSIDQYLSRLVFCALNNAERPSPAGFTVLDLSVGNVSAVDFTLPRPAVEKLIRDGREDAREFLRR